MSQPNKYIHLEFIRGIAAILVLLHHVRVMLFPFFEEFPNCLQNHFVRGYIFITGFNKPSVLVFFTLSGFLIIRKVMQSSGKWSWRNYLIDRLVRLWVVLLPSLLMTALLVWFGKNYWVEYAGGIGYILNANQVDISLASFFGNAFFLQTLIVNVFGDNGPLWSLSYEFWYYILFPLIILACRNVGQKRVFYCVLFFAASGCIWKLNNDILALCPCWLAGGLAVLASKWKANVTFDTNKRLFIAAVFQFIGMFVLHRVVRSGYVIIDYALAISVAFFIAISIKCSSLKTGKIYENCAVFMSNCSYSVYLFHNSFLGLLFYVVFDGKKVMPTASNMFIGLLFAVAAYFYSWLFYLVFERHTPVVRAFIKMRLN